MEKVRKVHRKVWTARQAHTPVFLADVIIERVVKEHVSTTSSFITLMAAVPLLWRLWMLRNTVLLITDLS